MGRMILGSDRPVSSCLSSEEISPPDHQIFLILSSSILVTSVHLSNPSGDATLWTAVTMRR
jgi:hypothetical protein